MLNLKKVKMILWDFDDTLCFHSDHSSPTDMTQSIMLKFLIEKMLMQLVK